MVQKGHIYFLNPVTVLRCGLFKYVSPFVTNTYESIEQNYHFGKTRAHIAYYVCIINVS